ncbi:MAG: CHAD domain-containing protein, partial [Acidimicrobiales bacterium]
LPDLEDVAESFSMASVPDRRLEATYYDTPDVRLARSGITLRFRTGDGSGWTLKFPEPGRNAIPGGLARRELHVPGADRPVPAELSSLVTAWVRTSPLVPVAKLRTLRRGVVLVDAEGATVAEVVDDEVTVLDGRRMALRFREVEAEVVDGAPDGLLHALVEHLRAAGAGPPDPTPKVVRALGPHASGPPELEEVPLGPDPSAGEVIRAGLVKAVLRVLGHEAGTRMGDDPHDVHQARVGTRRLRSDLRTYRPLLDPAWADGLREELKRLADPLGEVRDADVLLGRLRGHLADLRADDEAASKLLARLEVQRGEARRALMEVLSSRRHVALLDRLVEAARAPVLAPEATAPATEVLPELVRHPWEKLGEAVGATADDSSDEVLHQVRIRAKRCRYAAEVAAIAVGKPAHKLAEAVAELQEVLGDHHDAVVTEAWLREAAAGMSPEEALVAGQLLAVQRAGADAGRQGWPGAWEKASKRKLRAWLKP